MGLQVRVGKRGLWGLRGCRGWTFSTRSKGSIRSMGSKGWEFRKVRSAFPYFLFSASYSLFPCVFAPLRALRETKNFVPLSLRDFVLKKSRMRVSVSKNPCVFAPLRSFAWNKKLCAFAPSWLRVEKNRVCESPYRKILASLLLCELCVKQKTLCLCAFVTSCWKNRVCESSCEPSSNKKGLPKIFKQTFSDFKNSILLNDHFFNGFFTSCFVFNQVNSWYELVVDI